MHLLKKGKERRKKRRERGREGRKMEGGNS